jgi:ceramide glucosyltransferase
MVPDQWPPVTILKPLHGDEPLLEEALASFCGQDYPEFQIVFGLQDPADPALDVLARLRRRFPALDMAVVVDPTPHGTNRKVANLINMAPQIRHDVLVIADSDIHAAPGYLTQLVASLMAPGVGLATTLYAGLPSGRTLTGRLGAEQINHAFLPGALMARALGRQDCLGATMALRRQTLDSVGGLHALSNHLADDAVLGRLVKARGLSIALAGTVPATTVAEAHLPELFEHELRWARTIQSLEAVGFAMSSVQYPLFWSALAVGLSGGAGWAWLAFVLAWLVRGAAGYGIDRALGLAPSAGLWCLPFRDLMSIAVMLASYRTDQVAWRGQILRAKGPGLAPGSRYIRRELDPVRDRLA